MNPTGLLMVIVGVFLITRSIAKDSKNQTLPERLLGQTAGSSSPGASGAPAGPAAPTASVQGAVTPSDLNTIAAKMGWDSAQVNDWSKVIADESGGRPNAINPTTTRAYGIGQFFAPAPNNAVLPEAQQLALNRQKYFTYGGNPNTVMGQLTAMANYMHARYGNPAGALASENTAGHY